MNKHRNKFLMTAVMVGLASCATTTRESEQVIAARAAVSAAASDPEVNRHAAIELERARKSLDESASAAKAKRPAQIVDHHAYLAQQQARTAMQRAKAKTAEARIAGSEAERIKVQLEAREAEVRRVRSSAEAAQAGAAAAQNRAALSEAENARLLGEQQRLAEELSKLKAQPTPRGLVLTLGDVLFDSGRSDLKPGAMRALDNLTAFLKEYPKRSVQIEGFTDSVGSVDYNNSLSQRRADAVMNALATRGIEGSRIRAVGYGEAYPVASNDSAAGRQLNRRIEVIISEEGATVPAR